MKQNKHWMGAVSLWAAFFIWTFLVCRVDVQPAGPLGSRVGLATLNCWVHRLTGVHMTLYTLTDWLGLVPIAICLSFALVGLSQWMGRKSPARVDTRLFVLGGLYVLVIGVYVCFEFVTVNCRPVLIGGVLETSYPSSTTLLVLCVLPSALTEWKEGLGPKWARMGLNLLVWSFVLFMVAGRLVSGVHWFSDIVGSLLISGGLLQTYRWVRGMVWKKQDPA